MMDLQKLEPILQMRLDDPKIARLTEYLTLSHRGIQG
jgi:hypothetical protein